ncbi:MAG TPA: SDR family NAD(P)-dependent oxidoreductase [Anaerolineae bacterium]|nr:SDR family NAD(P)-dependent oxidoreductase [Anaerolineae bacterium]
MTTQKTNMSAQGKSVLITGCSSGIGRTTALRLARQGLTVFATVRKETDAEDLRQRHEPNLIPICPLDLTQLDQIPRVRETVTNELERRGLPGLYALINNAGSGGVAPIELMDLNKFGTELQARVLGSVAMVQAFLPLLRQANGRIVWIVTPATIPTPYVTSIHACDFAVNCVARTLALEVKDLPNIMIRCGGIKTPAGLRTTAEVETCLQHAPRDRAVLYEHALRAWGKDMAEFDAQRTEAEAVAEIILKALNAHKPRRRYSVGHMAGFAALLESMPQPLVDGILSKRF